MSVELLDLERAAAVSLQRATVVGPCVVGVGRVGAYRTKSSISTGGCKRACIAHVRFLYEVSYVFWGMALTWPSGPVIHVQKNFMENGECGWIPPP